jgi:hypothetical protein
MLLELEHLKNRKRCSEAKIDPGVVNMWDDIGGALPAFAQLAVSTYHAASASSHAAISQVTVHVEEQKSHPNSKSQLEDSQPKPASPQTAISQMR